MPFFSDYSLHVLYKHFTVDALLVSRKAFMNYNAHLETQPTCALSFCKTKLSNKLNYWCQNAFWIYVLKKLVFSIILW